LESVDKELHQNTCHIPKLAEVSDAAKAAETLVTYAASTHAKSDLTIDQHRYAAKLVKLLPSA